MYDVYIMYMYVYIMFVHVCMCIFVYVYYIHVLYIYTHTRANRAPVERDALEWVTRFYNGLKSIKHVCVGIPTVRKKKVKVKCHYNNICD